MSDDSSKLHSAVAESLKQHGIVFRVFACDPNFADTAAFCEHYGFTPQQSANTIIVALKGNPASYVCCVVTATMKLDVNKKVRSLTGKRGSFASAAETRELTGMEIGGVTAFGIDSMPMYVDAAVFTNDKIVMGGGNRTSKLLLNPEELKKLPNLTVTQDLGIPR